MGNVKSWWQSRTIWLGILTAIFAVLGVFGLIPEGLTAEGFTDAIMGVVGVLVIVLRLGSTHQIGGPGG